MLDMNKSLPGISGGPLDGGSPPSDPKRNLKPKRGPIYDCIHSLHQVLKRHNHLSVDGGNVSYATSRSREDILTQGFTYLNKSLAHHFRARISATANRPGSTTIYKGFFGLI